MPEAKNATGPLRLAITDAATFAAGNGPKVGDEDTHTSRREETPSHARPSLRQALSTGGPVAALWLHPVLALPSVRRRRRDPAGALSRDLRRASVNVPSALLALAAAAFRFKVGVIPLLLGCAGVGVVLFVAGVLA